MVAYAKQDKVLYGKAFDLVKCSPRLNLSDLGEIERRLDEIKIIEVKATRLARVGPKFENYFFSLSTAELLTAQSLEDRYRFVFVNVLTGKKRELTLHQIFSEVKNFYPTWSITF